MKSTLTLSEQLRNRRTELGLSLTDVARRAGTSPATLSRYENGWNRFETYTLRKLATALECELAITLRPRKRPPHAKTDTAKGIERLGRLFWDHPLREGHINAHPVWVVERILEYGQLNDLHLIQQIMGKESFLNAVAQARFTTAKAHAFWNRILEMEGRSCTRAFSRSTAWNY